VYRPVLLKGDYVSTAPNGRERQALAKKEGCLVVVDFHFNWFEKPAVKGGEVHFKRNSSDSEAFANVMWHSLSGLGLPAHGNAPVHEAVERSAFINFYEMPTVLLEPLFVSNADQAKWLHEAKNAEALAVAIADAIKKHVSSGTIGLSPGHAHKSSPDPGSKCAVGDNEVDHVLKLVERVTHLLA
jgi:N-acetylmuramoyl-L-alanine amidase